ncbi:HD-GYP domain-containing protein [Ideonella sp.]|uniref:HD-GYP domain-containing protein n=1 Tax=Ideonella sp. TaxID=1929293 RepID=UPI0035B187DC
METSQRTPLAAVRDLVAVGQPLPFHVHDPAGRRLLAEGQVIVSDTQLEMLMERGAWAESEQVHTARKQREAAGGGAGAALVSTYRRPSLFDRWERLTWDLDALLRKVLAGMACGPELHELADQLIAQVDRDVDVALFMTIRPPDTRFALYALTHALHAATVGVVLARQLGWPADRQHLLVRAALTMNVSILELQAHMAAEPDPPNARQRAAIRAHPEASVTLLMGAGVSDVAWLEAVRQHHERTDGQGYPAGRRDIDEVARALGVADVFTAKLSPRAFRQALPVQSAARQLFQDERGGPLAGGLIKALGLYPPGDLVALKNGEVAVVTHRGASATTPRVASLSNAAGQPVASSLMRDTAHADYAIVGPASDPRRFARVLPERVYGLIE